MNIFNFERMFSTQIVKVVYILGLIGIVISAIVYFFFASYDVRVGMGGKFLHMLTPLGILVIGTLLWRIICEGLIVIFLIYDKLADIKELLKK